MRKKEFRTILVLFILLLAIATGVYIVRMKSTSPDGPKALQDFAVEDTASVDKIYLANMQKESALLERTEHGWAINGKYTARKDAINRLLRTIHDIRVKAPVSDKMAKNINKDLAAAGTKVEIYQNGELTKVYYVGPPTQDDKGTFMKLDKSDKPFVTHLPGFYGYLTPRYFIHEHLWRDPEIFRYAFSDVASIRVEHPSEPEKSFTVYNYGNNRFGLKDYQDKEVKVFDTLAVKRYIAFYHNINYDTWLNQMPEPKKDSIMGTVPLHIFSVTDRMGHTRTLRSYEKKGAPNLGDDGTINEIDIDVMYGILNNSRDVFVIQYFVFDPLIQDIDYFLPGKD